MKADRKEAIRAYKTRITQRGVFALRCSRTGQAWVGSTPNLATVSGELFTLRQGSHRNVALQTAWNEYGEEAFQTEILEVLDEELAPVLLADTLKRQAAEWCARLGGTPLHAGTTGSSLHGGN